MRWLLPPRADEVDLAAVYATPADRAPGRPFVRANMISSLDGAIAIKGRSGGLGGPADQRLYDTLRSLTDVVLVGAGTMRTERYGPVRVDATARAQRLARGQSPVPPIAVVTRSCHLRLGLAVLRRGAGPAHHLHDRRCRLRRRRPGVGCR